MIPSPPALRRRRPRGLAALLVALTAGACTSTPATEARFDLDADLDQPAHFFDFPYPSDLRLTAAGTPDLAGFPNPDEVILVEQLRVLAVDRPGFPMVPVAYFRFSGPLAPRQPGDVIPAVATAPVLLVDVDPDSPTRGELTPTVAFTHPRDDYVPEHVLAVAARPGFVLHGRRRYAVVVMRSLGDAAGQPLGVAPAVRDLAAGRTPAGARGAAAAALYAPLWETLDGLGIARTEVASATVFTTGDVVAELADLSTRVRDAYTVSPGGFVIDPDDGATHERYCELHGAVTYPQFQTGTPPFHEGGRFTFGADGLPVKQRDEVAPVTITLPKQEMPPGGFPLVIFFHGSGGLSTAICDRGPVLEPGGAQVKGLGPAHVLAGRGFAVVSSALPVNPERLPGAPETAYLNFNNLSAFRDTFRQGVLEQRLLIAALRTLTIAPEVVAGCGGPTLPAGETAFRFNPDQLYAQGQSMGGMYTNLIAAVEPRILGAVPTGAGGLWSYFILETSLVPGAKDLLVLILGTTEDLTFMHPTLQLLETGWEPAEPLVYMPRLARRPLPGHPVRPIYEPVGLGDSYFPTVVYDAVALAYGHEEAGDIVWPTMQDALALADRDGLVAYPVSQNLTSETGVPYTGAIVQYEGDGLYDPHALYSQIPAVKFQFGCFLQSLRDTGTATIFAPQAEDAPCP
jgi:hypothetical protein